MRVNQKKYQYRAVIEPTDRNGAYVRFPYDIRAEFGKGVGDQVDVTIQMFVYMAKIQLMVSSLSPVPESNSSAAITNPSLR